MAETVERRLNLFTRFIPQPKGSDIVRENLDFRVKSIHVDDVGRFIILDTLIHDSPFLLVNIYAPTKKQNSVSSLRKSMPILRITLINQRSILYM